MSREERERERETIHIISNDRINFSFTISKASNNTAIKLFLELVLKFMSGRVVTIIIIYFSI
jgi:hypothetical protein